MKKKMTSDTFCLFKPLSGPLISPDGDTTAYVVNTVDKEENRYRGDIYLYNHEQGGSRRLTAQGDISSFVWTKEGTILFPAPRGKSFAAARAKAKPYTAFFEIDPKGGEATLKYEVPLSAGAPVFLEDGRWVLQSKIDLNRPDFESLPPERRGAAIEEYLHPRYEVFEELPFWFNGPGYLSRKRNTLFLFDPKTGAVERITPEYMEVAFWKCDFGKIVYAGCRYDDVLTRAKGLYLYDIAEGVTKTLIPEEVMELNQPHLVDENTILFGAVEKGSFNYANPDFWRYDLEKGTYRMLLENDILTGICGIPSDARLGMGQATKVYGGRYYFLTMEDEYVFVRSIDKEGKLSERLVQPGVTDMFDVGKRGLVACGMRGDRLAELYLVDENGGETRLTSHNDFIAEEYEITTPVPLKYTGSDGYEIRGWVIPPSGYEKGKKYPGILSIHGGPKAAFSDVLFHEMQMLAAAGYFVFFCNPRGSDGRGEDFASLETVMGTVDYVNFMEFTDEVLRLYPDIDPGRVGVTGGSYGGYMANWIIGHTSRFAAVCSQRSISNWITMEGANDMGYAANRFQFGVMVADDAKKLWDASPLQFAHNAVTPTLFIHSDQDYRCPLPEALQIFTTLRRKGVDSKLVLFHGENHGLSRGGKPKNRIKRLEEIQGWFDKYLH